MRKPTRLGQYCRRKMGRRRSSRPQRLFYGPILFGRYFFPFFFFSVFIMFIFKVVGWAQGRRFWFAGRLPVGICACAPHDVTDVRETNPVPTAEFFVRHRQQRPSPRPAGPS
ncbi:hypothetical protein TW95_gp1590 [Pandoravirus inopinatum]|uniref:Uncharacterized protein n=1 Tax=Pandoravirus inopinatum TaxID=1605721 RepID=A0A0B5J3Y9_9VIRU|nr:hypothetical protein TW95_gp1590 [Pandoravirus inopinatum]AJF98324.1 hypothetical protein [Pandoravirus inopinatum]